MALEFVRKVEPTGQTLELYNKLERAVGMQSKLASAGLAHVRIPEPADAPLDTVMNGLNERPLALQLVSNLDIRNRYPNLVYTLGRIAGGDGETALRRAVYAHNPTVMDLLTLVSDSYYVQYPFKHTFINLVLSQNHDAVVRDERSGIWEAIDTVAGIYNIRPTKDWFDKPLDVTMLHIPFSIRYGNEEAIVRHTLSLAEPIVSEAVQHGLSLELRPAENVNRR